jgi:hypothetical protein
VTDQFKLHSGRRQAPVTRPSYHTWQTPQGVAWAEFYRLPDSYLLRFPNLADFHIDRTTLAVSCHPAPGVTPQTIQHLFLNQVLPLVQSKRGQLVFHAAAVVIGKQAVAFAAASGTGKSTLVAAFALAGYPFLTDDGLVVEARGDQFLALPSHPSIRLWSDSEQALLPPEASMAEPVSYTSKGRYLADEKLVFCETPQPLGRVYFLDETPSDSVRFEPVKSSDALIRWVRHSFLLDIEERARLTTHFAQVGALVKIPIHYRLEYPRNYDRLNAVIDAIVEHAGGGR